MGVMNAYGLSAEDATHVSDVFFNTVNKGVVTGPELAASLGPVTQSAKAAGVGLNEMGAMIAAKGMVLMLSWETSMGRLYLIKNFF